MLDRIKTPADLKINTDTELSSLAAEIRKQMVETISTNGGHLASSLGAVELTIALHRVFNSPLDKIIWDVGHQAYAHKMLTGRLNRFYTIRQYGGLSGFPVPDESPHDAFVAGHAGNSISAAVGMAIARDLNKEKYEVIAVIGDGSLGAGMAFEAINHAGHIGAKIIVILNDNGMSISPSVGALSRLMNRVRLDSRYEFAKKTAQKVLYRLPWGRSLWKLSQRMKNSMESFFIPSAFWEQFGFTYLGPLDGHNIQKIEPALKRARDLESGPTVIHILTTKGKGYPEAENNVVKYHGISPNGMKKSPAPSYSRIFGQTVMKIMRENDKVVAITAAMLDGTGLDIVAKEFPNRVFDVGICEQHAVTLAAGMSACGLIPIVAIYSTFLQRSYDQIIHDVCLPELPVVFAIDRAGIVGDDGKTHQGPFDMSFLRCIPNMIVASPADENELQHLLYTGINTRQPMAIRYPRGNGNNMPLDNELNLLPIGKGQIMREGKDLSIVAIGPSVQSALKAAEVLFEKGIDCEVINARFVKPLDSELILEHIKKTGNVLTVEESALYGGFGTALLELVNAAKLDNIKIECLGLPDRFIEHGSQEILRSILNIDAAGIASCIKNKFPELLPKLSTSRGGNTSGSSPDNNET